MSIILFVRIPICLVIFSIIRYIDIIWQAYIEHVQNSYSEFIHEYQYP